MIRHVNLLIIIILSASCWVSADQISISSKKQQVFQVKIPDGNIRLSLLKAWGRLPKSSKPWILEGKQLPVFKVSKGVDWVELSLNSEILKNTNLEIYRFELDLSGAKGWSDTNGDKTWVRRTSWKSLKMMTRISDKQNIWPTVPGLSAAYLKRTSPHGMKSQGGYSGFSTECFSGSGKIIQTVDYSGIARVKSGKVLYLAANRSISVSVQGKNKISISAIARNLKAGEKRNIPVRVYFAKGGVKTLGDKWAADMDNASVRLVYVGDSVGAARGSYTGLLAKNINQTFGSKVRNLNASHGGDTTAIALKGYQGNVVDYKANVVMIQLCYNDVERISPKVVGENLKKMIDPILARKGGRVLILTPLSYDKIRVDARIKKDGINLNDVHTKQYIPVLKKLVASYESKKKTKGKVGFANIWVAMQEARKKINPNHRLLLDGSHPHGEGYQIIADCAWPELERLVKDSLKDIGTGK